MKKLLVVLAVVAVGAVGVSFLKKGNLSETKVQTVDRETGKSAEVGIEEMKVGDGALAEKGKMVTMHYSTYLKSTMKKIDSSIDRGQEFKIKLGAGQVVRGWELGVEGMKVGGKRKITVPAILGYGEKGAGRVVPPNSELLYEVELLSVTDHVPAQVAQAPEAKKEEPKAKEDKKSSKKKK